MPGRTARGPHTHREAAAIPPACSSSGVVGWPRSASLARIQAVVSQVDAAVHDHVATLHDRGLSWTQRAGARRVEAGSMGAVLRRGLTMGAAAPGAGVPQARRAGLAGGGYELDNGGLGIR